MNLSRIIVASVATHGVFERFAKLSKDDKKKVVEKVKEKVKTKSKPKKDDKKTKSKAKPKKDDKKGKKPSKGKIPPQFLKKDDKEEKPEEKKDEKAEKPAKGKIPPQFLKKDDKEEKSEEGKEEGMSEETNGLEGIVDGLVKEVEVIKGDGKVEMSEVMGLIDNMMKMVDTLVNSKAPRKKKASEDIADRVALSVMGADWETSDVENAIRDHLSGTKRKTKEKLMYNMLKREFKGLSSRDFRKVWEELVDEKYLVAIPDGSYVWEM